MESQAVRYLKKPIIVVAILALVGLIVTEFHIISLKEGGDWFSEHNRGEFALAVFPNVIAGLLAFVLVYLLVERREERKRYISAMRAVRSAVGKTTLTELQIQDLMVVMVKEISQLHFRTDMPRSSDESSREKPSCAICPTSSCPQKGGRCSKCKEIPECWSIDHSTSPLSETTTL